MRICSGSGCLRAVADDVRFCDECKPSAAGDGLRNHTSGYDAELDRLNKSARWQSVRARAIKRCPMCARCNAALSQIVDHIVPAAEAVSQAQLSGKYPGDKFAGYFIASNLQCLCRPCHGRKTLEDKAHVGPWPDVMAIERAAPKKVWTF